MKKHFTLWAGIAMSIALSYGQTTVYNGENLTPDFWDIGGGFGTGYDQGPNGADCKQNEGWKLAVSGKMDIMNEGINNPDVGDINNTAKVVRFVRAKNGEGWAGAGLDVSAKKIKENSINKISILVKKPVEGNVSLKLEGNGVAAQQQTQLYNTPGQWQKLTFTFESATFSDNPATLLIFPHDQGGLADNIITYWDEVTTYDASENATVIYNGNDTIGTSAAPGFFLDGYWGPNGSLSDLLTDKFPNLNPSGANTSNNVMRFIRAKDGKSWCGMGLGGQSIDVAATPVFSVMINKPVAGRVGMKLEGAGSQELYANYETPGEWTKVNFTFDPTKFTGKPTTIVIFPHFEDTDITPLAAHMPMYLDNVTFSDTITSIANTNDASVIVKSNYFSISGLYITDDVNELTNGIYIQRNNMDNGQIVNRKFMKLTR